MRSRIIIIATHCERCGKPIHTASRSVLGLDGLKARLGNICSQCIGTDKEHELHMAIGGSIIERAMFKTAFTEGE